MRILLIKSGNTQARAPGITPPLGLMYIASYLREKRADDVRIFDTRLYKDSLDQISHIIRELRPDVVGISALTLEAPAMFQIACLVKQYTCAPVVVGGPHITSVPEEVMKNKNIDFGVIGEGEITVKELLDALDRSKSLENIQGLIYRNNGNIKMNCARKYIDDIDQLPFPAFDLVEIEKYSKKQSMSHVGIRRYMVMLTSRGCPFHCTYCHNILGKKFRARSVENVLEEMNILINDYHINDFEIIDDISNFDKERIKSIFKGITNNNWKVRLSFPNGVRADMLDEETISLMKKAGTVEIAIAIETASERLQKLVKKNLKLEKVRRIIDIAVNEGIFLCGFFMVGFPTETEEELKQTINFACKSRLHLAIFFIVNPFNGTELRKQIEEKKAIKDVQYEDFDYTAMAFNASDIFDKRFHWLHKLAYIRFYANPVRIVRIIKDKPMLNDIFIRFEGLLRNYLPVPRGNRKFKIHTKNV